MFLGGLARASWHKQRGSASGVMFPSDIAPSQSICCYSGRQIRTANGGVVYKGPFNSALQV